MQLLAIDLGDKRTGMAVGDSETGIVTPVDTIESPGGDHLLEAIGRYAREYGADRLVIGLPRHDGGRESDRSRAARAFAARLHETLNLPVHFQDERYSSAAADDQMSRSGLTHREKKRRRDALAAAVILRDFLNRTAPTTNPDLR